MKKFLLGVIAIVACVSLVACGEKKEEVVSSDTQNNSQVVANNTTASTTTVENNTQEETSVPEIENVPKDEQIGTAGSNIPLKDNLTEARNQVEIAFKNYVAETWGSDIEEVNVREIKVYSAEEEQAEPALAEQNLGANEVAFSVNYELKLVEGVDGNQYTAGSGVYDEATRMVTEKSNVGILRPNPDEASEQKYVIDGLNTGF